MNILPKKRWHVRTKENIARVRKDEAEAAEKERARQQSIKLAESEARTAHLREKARQSKSSSEDFISLNDNDNVNEPTDSKEHINFFKDVEDGTAEYKKTNKEYEKEKKEEKEKYEKQIGYLTYLGQDTNEALGKRCWYEELPSYKKTKTVDNKDDGEVKLKQKSLEDPMVLMKKYAKVLETAELEIKSKVPNYDGLKNKNEKSKGHIKKKKSKKHKRSKSRTNSESDKERSKSKKRKRKSSKMSESSSSDEDRTEEIVKKQKLEFLRAERINREKEERRKSNELLARFSGGKKDTEEINNDKQTKTSGVLIKQKYNSQFNPTLAKQNYK